MKYILCIALLLGSAAPTFAQDELYKTVKEFFRVNPFAGKFSSFIEALKTDPELDSVKIVEKTDTSLFSIKGNYKHFNPFPVKANKIEMYLAEKRFVQKAPWLEDTLVLYQITGYFDSTNRTAKALEKQYKQINRKIKHDLPLNSEGSLKNIINIKDGVLTNHAFSSSVAAPLTVAWFTRDDGQLGFLIVLRMSFRNNQAVAGTTVYDYLDELR